MVDVEAAGKHLHVGRPAHVDISISLVRICHCRPFIVKTLTCHVKQLAQPFSGCVQCTVHCALPGKSRFTGTYHCLLQRWPVEMNDYSSNAPAAVLG